MVLKEKLATGYGEAESLSAVKWHEGERTVAMRRKGCDYTWNSERIGKIYGNGRRNKKGVQGYRRRG